MMRLRSVTPKRPPFDKAKYEIYQFGLEALWRSIINNGGTIHEPEPCLNSKTWRVTWPNKEK